MSRMDWKFSLLHHKRKRSVFPWLNDADGEDLWEESILEQTLAFMEDYERAHVVGPNRCVKISKLILDKNSPNALKYTAGGQLQFAEILYIKFQRSSWLLGWVFHTFTSSELSPKQSLMVHSRPLFIRGRGVKCCLIKCGPCEPTANLVPKTASFFGLFLCLL